MLENLPKNKKIILFDGVCNLCERSIVWVIKHDKNDKFRFVSLQSELGNALAKHIGIDANYLESIVLYEPGVAYYTKSIAVFEIFKTIGGIYTIVGLLSYFNNFNNFIYDWVAKNRYHWYGKKETCLLPTPEIQAKFL